MSYKSLLLERDSLRAENLSLQEELHIKANNSATNDAIAAINKETIDRGGKYGNIIYHEDYHSKWKDTFFDKQRLLIEKLNALPLNRIPNNNINSNLQSGSFIGYCEMIAPSKNGPVIKMVDPYGSFKFKLNKTSFEEAAKWIDRIIIVDASFDSNGKLLYVTRVQVLSFTLHEDLRSNR